LKNINVINKSGFTLLEVMVALAIIGISIGIFFGLIGNSSRLREKIDVHTKSLFLAQTKTEEAFLGLLGKQFKELKEKKTYEGISKDGVQWKVLQTNKYKEAMEKIGTYTAHVLDEDGSEVELPPKNTTLLSTAVEGITIETIFFAKESETDSDGKADTTPDLNVTPQKKNVKR